MSSNNDQQTSTIEKSVFQMHPVYQRSNDPPTGGTQHSEQNTLQQILNELKGIKSSLDVINKKVLLIENKQKEIETEITISKKEAVIKHLAENKMARKNLCYIKQINKNVNKLCGGELSAEDSDINAIFPLQSLADLADMEEKLENQDYAMKVAAFLKRAKINKNIEDLFRMVGDDIVYFEFNVDGRCGKRSLLKLKLFNSIIFKAFGEELLRKDYEANLRKCILRSHNRFNKAKSTSSSKVTTGSSKKMRCDI